MFLNKPFPYLTSFRNHFLIALILSFVIVFILIFLQPFGSGNFNSPYKNIYFMGYGLISFLIYLTIHFLSKWYYTRLKIWKWGEELIFCFFYISLSIIIAFLYTEIIINQKPERLNLKWFLNWFQTMFLGFGLILTVFTILLRNYFGSVNLANTKKQFKTPHQSIPEKKILLQGTLKKERLWVNEATIAYVKSEDNYVYLYFVEGEELNEKMLRSTLTKINLQLPSLIKAHRSYLINPGFIIALKGNAQNAKLKLKTVEKSIPVSKTHFETIKRLIT